MNRLVLEDGRCAGVETETGERFLAREAVVSTIHVKHLVDMAPADAWGEDFRYGVETFDVGVPVQRDVPRDDAPRRSSRRRTGRAARCRPGSPAGRRT